MTDSVELSELIKQAHSDRDEIIQDCNVAYERAEDAWRNRRVGEAIGICQDIIDRLPGQAPEVYALLGEIEGSKGNVDRAVFLLTQATKARPEVGLWHLLLCDQLYRKGQWEEGVQEALVATSRMSQSPEPYIRLARGYGRMNNYDDQESLVRRSLLKALALDNDHPLARQWLGELLLASEDFRSGWREYEWRLKRPELKDDMPHFHSAEWNGMEIRDGRILIVHDGGFGDMIQFARFVPMVAQRCKEAVVLCPPELAPVMFQGPDNGYRIKVITSLDDVPAHAAHVAMISLPYIFNADWSTIAGTPPLDIDIPHDQLVKAKDYVERSAPDKRRIGLCWAGRPTHANDDLRSIPFQFMDPLRHVEGVQFFSLQVPIPVRDRDLFRGWFRGGHIVTPDIRNWMDTAALVANLDEVISVDTAVAHLAGSLRRHTILLLPQGSDWRWMKNRTFSPWYEKMDIMRCDGAGWHHLIEQAASLVGR